MYVDKSLEVSDAQAFTGAATLSTNVIDLGRAGVQQAHVSAAGKPLGFAVTVDVAAGSGTTVLLEILQSAADDLSASDVIASFSDVAANLPTAHTLFLPLPKGYPTKRYIGLRTTCTGGTTTITLTASLMPEDLFEKNVPAYAKGYVS